MIVDCRLSIFDWQPTGTSQLRRAIGDRKSKIENQESEIEHANTLYRHSLCNPQPVETTRFDGHRNRYSCTWHRREYCDLQRGECHRAASATISRLRSTGGNLGKFA